MPNIEEVKKILDKAIQADLVDGRIGTEVYADQISQLFPQPLTDEALRVEIGRLLDITCLTAEEPDIEDQILTLLQQRVEQERERVFKELLKHQTPTIKDLGLIEITMCVEDWQALSDKKEEK